MAINMGEKGPRNALEPMKIPCPFYTIIRYSARIGHPIAAVLT